MVFSTEYILDLIDKLVDDWDTNFTDENIDMFYGCIEEGVLSFDLDCIKKLFKIRAKVERIDETTNFLCDEHIDESLCLSNGDKKYTFFECIEALTTLGKYFLMYDYLIRFPVKELECFTDMFSTEQKNFIVNTFINYTTFNAYHTYCDSEILTMIYILENDFCNPEQKDKLKKKLDNMKGRKENNEKILRSHIETMETR